MNIIKRKKTKEIRIGSVRIGGANPVAVQSMTKTDTRDVKSTVRQVRQLEDSGCEIIRVAVPDMESARLLGKIKSKIGIPLVADIHYDYRIALESIKQGADKIRINPGNIGSKERVKLVVKEAKKAGIPVRIGINSGSLKVEGKSGLSDEMANTALNYVKMFEDWDFSDIVISLKASNVLETVDSYRKLSGKTNYPLHLGITESGPPGIGIIKSSIGIGILLHEGIGDTLRVSLTASPFEEVETAFKILDVLDIRKRGVEIISCPTCSRCRINMLEIVGDFEKQLALNTGKIMRTAVPVKVAIMGCEVNGPGEARHADIGIAGGRNTGILFRKGKPVRKVKPELWSKTLINEIISINK